MPPTTPATDVRPYLDEAASFRATVTQWREEAARAKADLETEIERLEVEIQARTQRAAEHAEIVARCDAALAVTLTVPAKATPALQVSNTQTAVPSIGDLLVGRPDSPAKVQP